MGTAGRLPGFGRGGSLKTTVAFCNELVDVYLARNIRKVGDQDLDPAESISLKAFEPEELKQMIFDFTIQDGKTVAGILAYLTASSGK